VEHRDFHCKGFKSVTDAGTFTGFASTYEKDLVGDVIEPGAFNQAIKSQGSGIPVLWNHDGSTPIGKTTISDSRAGLIANGALLMTVPAAKTAFDLMKNDVVRGLSIGFTIDDPTAVSYDSDGVRHIKSLHLYEISAVCFPANPSARITAVKSLGQVEQFIRQERARISKSAAGMDDEMVAHLRQIHEHVLSMLDECDPGEDDDCEGDLVPVDENEDLVNQLSTFAAELKQLTAA
jgi:HK97 family phage prohead protease